MMKRTVFYIVLGGLLALMSYIVAAQDERIDYTSTSGDVTIMYPAEWVSTEMVFPGLPTFYVVANSEAALENTLNEIPAAGDLSVWITLFPESRLLEDGLAEEASPDELIQHVFYDFFGAGAEVEETNAVVSEPQVVAIDDSRDAGVITFIADPGDGYNIAYEVADGVIIYGFSLVASGELTEAAQEQILTILSSVEFSGTAEDLVPTTPEMTVYTSEAGLFSLSYPSGWVTEASENPGVTAANSPEAVERMLTEQPFQPSDEGITVLLFNRESFFGMSIPAEIEGSEALIEYLSEFFVAAANAETEVGAEPAMTVGEVETVELSNGVEVGILPFTLTGLADGVLVASENPEGVVIFAYGAAAPGEFGERVQATTLDVVASLQFIGSPEDLLPLAEGQ